MSDQTAVAVEITDDRVLATMDVPDASPAELLAAFCEPDRVRRWWGGDLTFQPHPGGAYVVHFSQRGQTMRGEVIAYVPGDQLSFTWSWDHQPEIAPLRVTVHAFVTAGGARLRLEHGPYDDNSRGEAGGHRDGWEYFLPRLLREVTGGTADG